MTTLHRLEIFAAAAKHQSLTKAAEASFISQPGISTQLKLLEQEYGAKLYTRTSRGIVLTPKGVSLLAEIQAILSRIENLPKKINRTATATRIDSLTVGGTPSTSSLFLPSMLAKFKRSQPKAQISLRTTSNLQIEEMVLNSRADIALVTQRPNSSHLISERYGHGRFVAFAAPDFHLPRIRNLAVGDLSRIPLVVRNFLKEGRLSELLKWCERQDVKLNIAMRCDAPDAVKTAVHSGMGVGILFEDLVKSDVRKGLFKIVKIHGVDLATSSFIIYRKEPPLSPEARRFRAILRDHLRQEAVSNLSRRGRKESFLSTVA